MELEGDTVDVHWGAVLIAEWHIEKNGSVVKILVPPMALKALKAPGTFAKIEMFAAYKLPEKAKRLYGTLADKKRQRMNEWRCSREEAHEILQTTNRKAYVQWYPFKRAALDPTIEAINDFGTVKVWYDVEKEGKIVRNIIFRWKWKSLEEIEETGKENERHSVARRKQQPDEPDAPPTITSDTDRLKQEWLDWSNANPGGIYSDFLYEKRSRQS